MNLFKLVLNLPDAKTVEERLIKAILRPLSFPDWEERVIELVLSKLTEERQDDERRCSRFRASAELGKLIERIGRIESSGGEKNEDNNL